MRCEYACQSSAHTMGRRSFLSGLAGLTAGGLMLPSEQLASSLAGELKGKNKQILVVFLAGGVSQLETWDPKPGVETGGPFRSIPTSVPGVHFSELLPLSAKQMHRLSIVRSINTKENDHGKGAYAMQHGHKQDPAAEYPHFGAVAARMLAPQNGSLPGYIQITPKGGGGRNNDAAYLGAKYSSVVLGGGNPPADLVRLQGFAEEADLRRNTFRKNADEMFLKKRRTAMTEAYTYSFDQAARLMEQKDVFDVTKESEKDQDRYGKYDFGRQMLLARRLISSGVSFVQVQHTNYDSHYENFEFHIEQLGEFDRPFACLIQDLADMGLLESTLVVVMSEFGRTPGINQHYGRDHWGTAWSVAMAGAKLQPGAVIGKTDEKGTAVVDREVHHGHLFHTYLQAVGVDSTAPIQVGGRPTPIADPSVQPIKELIV